MYRSAGPGGFPNAPIRQPYTMRRIFHYTAATHGLPTSLFRQTLDRYIVLLDSLIDFVIR